MSVSLVHLFEQGQVISALLKIAARSARGSNSKSTLPGEPGPAIGQTVPPRKPRLVADYVRNVGGTPSAYRRVLPAHMFPQWGFPLMSATLADLPYDVGRILNVGCRIEFKQAIPSNEPLELEARLVEVDDDGRRALVTQELVTGTARAPRALVCRVTALFPLAKTKGKGTSDPKGGKKTRERPRVPVDAREIDRWKLGAKSGLDFALLTGDFNPIHWIPAAARMAGFKNTILHGFGTLARTVESLIAGIGAGDARCLASIDVRFVKPVVLPARVGVYIDGEGGCFVGDAPGGPAYLTGTYELRRTQEP